MGLYDYLSQDERLILFYNEICDLLHKDREIAEKIFRNAIAYSLLTNDKLQDKKLHVYEYILTSNFIRSSEYKENLLSLKPFDYVDYPYYERITYGNTKEFQTMYLVKMLERTVEKDNPDCFNLQTELLKLKDILRTGWIRRNVDEYYIENDLMHITQMIALASAYKRIYKIDNINMSKVIEMILIHEAGELIIGDIPETDPNHDNKYEKEHEAIIELFGNVEKGKRLIRLWEEFDKKESEEAKFAYQLDKLDAILKANYLDKKLNRNDLFKEFSETQLKKETFTNESIEQLVRSLN